jgi:hypothetical protein
MMKSSQYIRNEVLKTFKLKKINKEFKLNSS